MYRIIGADGREYGPVTAEQLRQWLTEGRANHQTRVQLDGTADWKVFTEFPELMSAMAGTAPPVMPTAPAPRPQIPNYLAQSILVTLFCCLPFGIVSIVYAAQVNSKLQAGDVTGAQESSRKAKTWCWLSVGGWLLVVFAYAIFFVLRAAGGSLMRG